MDQLMTQPDTTPARKRNAAHPSEDRIIADRRQFLSRSVAMIGAGALAVTAANGQSAANPDIAVLNYALTLEHLEAAFYNQGLTRLSAADFQRASAASVLGSTLSSSLFSYLEMVRAHENAHVTALSAAIRSLGGTPVAACTYNFQYNTADEFLTVAALLENAGVMAYDGAIALLQSKELQTAGAAIATVEARHAAYLNLVTGTSPFPAAFDMPKSMREILAAAAPFITSCPTGPTPPTTATKAVLLPKGFTAYTNLIQLDGTTSVSGDGKPLTYSVRQTGGNPISIQNANTATPTVQFVAFGRYEFELTVTDSTGATAKDTTTIDYNGR